MTVRTCSLARRWLRLTLVVAAIAGYALVPAAAVEGEWVVVDYSELVDLRRLSHSGASVGRLLQRLDGRALPPGGGPPPLRHVHRLLDPLVEPYAFVLSDAVDSRDPLSGAPWVEVAGLWAPGAAQPAWVELLRARRFLVESDGTGRLRVFVPWTGDVSARSQIGSQSAAREAWGQAWPVLRHVLAAERRRLVANRSDVESPTLDVEVRAYVHRRDRSAFLLGVRPWRLEVSDTLPDGMRPPLDLTALDRFLRAGLRVEGGRLDRGGLLLLGSQTGTAPSLLGRPLSSADFAVAYRAVFRGGLSEPYMSLDRGFYPQEAIVNYGGRLRDTSLGMVSLLCDIRFKTFSVGVGIARGEDLRPALRERLPEFRAHLERLAADPRSEGLSSQQTRLWFYPDDVDLTLSASGDVMVLDRVRMSAASERVDPRAGGAEASDVPPWTRATVEAINRDYDVLAELFPELVDLDRVVELLALFTWMRQAELDGRRLPDLDSLLALELPALTTPRTYPQLLTFNVLPGVDSGAEVIVADRVSYAAALHRLHPATGRPLDARRRYARAVGALIAEEPEHAALLDELRGRDLGGLDDSAIDDLTFRAERIGMLARTSLDHYRRLLTRVPPEIQRQVATLSASGTKMRPTMLAIGGLDLGMGKVLDRARGRRMGIGEDGATQLSESAPAEASEPREEWREDPPGLPRSVLPDHGLGRPMEAGDARRDFGGNRIEVGGVPGESGKAGWISVLLGKDGPEPQSRRIELDGAQVGSAFERFEDGRFLRYRFEDDGQRLLARSLDRPLPPVAPQTSENALRDRLALLHLPSPGGEVLDAPSVALRMEVQRSGARTALGADVPRSSLRRLVLGIDGDRTPERPIPGLAPLPPLLGDATSLMVVPDARWWSPPWDTPPLPRPGEENPERLARAFNARWRATDDPRRAVIGIDGDTSPLRWAFSPKLGEKTLLVLPEDGFPPGFPMRREALLAAWGDAPLVTELPEKLDATLVVFVSAEPAGQFAQSVRALAESPAMRDRLLAVWSLGGGVRADLPASLLEDGQISGLGLGAESFVDVRRADRLLERFAVDLGEAGTETRVETLDGPFVWVY